MKVGRTQSAMFAATDALTEFVALEREEAERYGDHPQLSRLDALEAWWQAITEQRHKRNVAPRPLVPP